MLTRIKFFAMALRIGFLPPEITIVATIPIFATIVFPTRIVLAAFILLLFRSNFELIPLVFDMWIFFNTDIELILFEIEWFEPTVTIEPFSLCLLRVMFFPSFQWTLAIWM